MHLRLDEAYIKTCLESRGYDMKGSVGSGNFGACYLVYSYKYKQDFVCKVTINKQENKMFEDSYNREVRALINFTHPNILRSYEVFTFENYLFMILEYCGGGNIMDHIKEHGLIKPLDLVKFTAQVIDSLDYMHSLGYAHRDIKPQNILIDNNCRIKMADFGLTENFNDPLQEKKICGSLQFMAPELLKDQNYDPMKADIWALGVTIHKYALGYVPFNGFTPEQMLEEIDQGYKQIKTIPPPLSVIIQMCLQKDPSKRPSMSQLKQIMNQSVNPSLNKRHSSLRSKVKPFSTGPNIVIPRFRYFSV